MAFQPVEREKPLLGTRSQFAYLALLAFLVLAGLRIRVSIVNDCSGLSPLDVSVYGNWEIVPGGACHYRALVRNGGTGSVLPGVSVSLCFDSAACRASADTGPDGVAVLELKIPKACPTGSSRLRFEVSSPSLGRVAFDRAVTVLRPVRCLLTTDKPLYQPGQTMHMRVLVLEAATMKPAAGKKVVFEVFDARNNKVFHEKASLSAYGIASADFLLARQVNLGDYIVRAALGKVDEKRRVQVKRYRLPTYSVKLETDSLFYKPGELLKGELTARYTFGKPVSNADVHIVASRLIEKFRPFMTLDLRLDQDGRGRFEIRLPKVFTGHSGNGGDGVVEIAAEVTDRAGRVHSKALERRVTTRPLRISIVPEGNMLFPGVENRVYLFTSYADGRPARTVITIEKEGVRLNTSSSGVAVWKFTPGGKSVPFTAVARDKKGLTCSQNCELKVAQPMTSLCLRTDRAVYTSGQSMAISVFGPANSRRVFIDLVCAGTTLTTRALDLKDGIARRMMDIPLEARGTLELRACVIRADGSVLCDTRVIQVKSSDALNIRAKLDADTYIPASTAGIDIELRRPDGSPVQGALSLSAVDEAVFALNEMRPGLERAFFNIRRELLKPRYVVYSKSLDVLLASGRPELERLALNAAGGSSGKPEAASNLSYQERLERAGKLMASALESFWLLTITVFVFLGSLLLIPIIVYGGWRLFVRAAYIEKASDEERTRLASLVLSIRNWWTMAWLAPVMVTLFFEFFVPCSVHKETLAGVVTLIIGAVAIFVMRRYLGGLDRLPVSDAVPCARSLLHLLPWAALSAYIALFIQLFRDSAFRWHSRPLEDVLLATTVLMFLFAWCTSYFVAVIASSFSRRRGFFFLILSPFVWLPLLFVALLVSIPFFQDNLVGSVKDREQLWLAGGRAVPSCAAAQDKSAISGKQPSVRVRRNFPETLYWNPQLVTDNRGRAHLDIRLPDSITTWRLGVSAVSDVGEMASTDVGIRVFQDFFIDVDAPVKLTQNDVVTIPIAVYNYLDKPQTVKIELKRAQWYELKGDAVHSLRLEASGVTSVRFVIVAKKPGSHSLLVRAVGTSMSDAVERSVAVQADGVPGRAIVNGRIDGNLDFDIDIPADAIEGSIDCFAKVYPGGFSQVLDGLEGLLRMPCGCFEQTSSSTYPNILILDYLRQNNKAKPELEMKAVSLIQTGYQRLLSFECAKGGFEWFGKEPPNNVLTAYGLMEFVDMSRVVSIDKEVIDRTTAWLVSDQNDDGTWTLTRGGCRDGAINDKEGDCERCTAYIAWALAESGRASRQVKKALRWLETRLKDMKDPYSLALASNAFIAADSPCKEAALSRLLAAKRDRGKCVFWNADGKGAVQSAGLALDVETTALAAYALLRSCRELTTARRALTWLIEQRDPNGAWASTQATIHALRALLAVAHPVSPGGKKSTELNILVDGEPASSRVLVTSDTVDVVHLVDLRSLVAKGRNHFRFTLSGDDIPLAYSVVARYYTPREDGRRPDSGAGKPGRVSIEVDYDTLSLAKNDTLTGHVRVTYNRDTPAAMTIVDLGVPPGFELLTGGLDELVKKGVIAKYSLAGCRLILYFRELAPHKPLCFDYKMRAKYPVRVKTPRSWIYDYYEPEVRAQSEPVNIEIHD